MKTPDRLASYLSVGVSPPRLNSCSLTPFAPPSRSSRNFARKIFFRSAPQQPYDKYIAFPPYQKQIRSHRKYVCPEKYRRFNGYIFCQ